MKNLIDSYKIDKNTNKQIDTPAVFGSVNSRKKRNSLILLLETIVIINCLHCYLLYTPYCSNSNSEMLVYNYNFSFNEFLELTG